MLKTNVIKRRWAITCKTPNGGGALITVDAESQDAALGRPLPAD